jgi:hypothetical protein
LSRERATDNCTGILGYHTELVIVIDDAPHIGEQRVSAGRGRTDNSIATNAVSPSEVFLRDDPFVLAVTSAEKLRLPSFVINPTTATTDSTGGFPVDATSVPWHTNPHVPRSVLLEKPLDGGCCFFKVM